MKRWEPGTVIRKTFDDGFSYYGRLLEFPWAAFYDYRTKQPVEDLLEITARPVLFMLAAHKDLVAKGEWKAIGLLPLEESLHPPSAQAIWDLLDSNHCQIIDDKGNIREATSDECKDLEPAAVWEPEHIADRLADHYAGRPNRWLKEMLPRRR